MLAVEKPSKPVEIFSDPLWKQNFLGRAIVRDVLIDSGHKTVYCKVSWIDDPESSENRWVARSEFVN